MSNYPTVSEFESFCKDICSTQRALEDARKSRNRATRPTAMQPQKRQIHNTGVSMANKQVVTTTSQNGSTSQKEQQQQQQQQRQRQPQKTQLNQSLASIGNHSMSSSAVGDHKNISSRIKPSSPQSRWKQPSESNRHKSPTLLTDVVAEKTIARMPATSHAPNRQSPSFDMRDQQGSCQNHRQHPLRALARLSPLSPPLVRSSGNARSISVGSPALKRPNKYDPSDAFDSLGTTGPQPRYWSGDFEPDRIVESHLQGSKPNTRVSTKEPADNTTTTLVDLATSAITSDTNPADSPSSGFKTPTPMAESPSGWDQPVNLGSPHPVLVPDGEWRPELLHASYDIETWRQASAQASSADPNEFVDNIKDEEGYHGENRIVEAGFPGSAQKKQIAAITDSTVGTGDDKVGQKPGAELGDDVLQMSSSRESESRSQPVMVPPQENNTTTVSTAAIDGVIRSPVVQCATSQLQPQPKSTTNLTTQLAAMNGSFQDSNGDEQSDASEVKLIEVGNSPKQFSDTSLKNHHPNLQDDIFSSLEDGQLALDLGPPLLDVPGTAASQPSHAGKRENDTTATDDCTATGNAQVGDLSSHPESGVSSRHDPTVAVNHGSIGADAAASSSSNLAPKRLLTLMDSNWSKSRQISQQRPQPVRHVRHQQVHLAQDQWQQWQAPHGQHMALQHPGYIRPTQAIIHFPHHPPPPPLLPPPPPQVMVWSHPSVLPRKEVPQGHQIRVSNHPIHSFTHELYEGDDVKAASLVCSRCQASMSEAEATATIATTTRTTLSPPVTFSSSSLTVDPTGDGSNQGTGSNLAVPERRRYDREFLMKFANIKNTAIPVPLQDCIETSQSESDEQKERGERTEESGDQAVVTAMLDTEANKKAEAIAEPAAALVKDGGHVDSKLASTLRARGYIRQPVGPNSLEDKGFRTYRRGNSF